MDLIRSQGRADYQLCTYVPIQHTYCTYKVSVRALNDIYQISLVRVFRTGTKNLNVTIGQSRILLNDCMIT